MQDETKTLWIHCPFCGAKTETKIYPNSLLLHFPLYCPNCDKEYSVDIIQRKIYSSYAPIPPVEGVPDVPKVPL